MRYQLIKEINPKYSALQQVLTNRGIAYEDIPHYINTTDDDINDFKLLGEDKLKTAASLIISKIKNNYRVMVIQDSDVDGYTSAALLINYLHDLFPAWTENNLKWFIHNGKQHGLNDYPIDDTKVNGITLVLTPDAGSNDIEVHKKFFEEGIDVICLDHHIVEEESKYAIVINNQNSNYPNKYLSGVGVTWQFCRYLDSILNTSYSDNYLDLVALGLTADMMDLKSIETKHLINKGFSPENIHNPFIYEMWQKNKFKLGERITSWGAAFYIAPFVNATVRSGTQEEKELIFESMLYFKAFKEIPSTKRGCQGEEEKLVEQAVRTCSNIKNRQTKNVEEAENKLENQIKEKELLNNKVLLFLLEEGEIDKNIAGLVANRMMAKYQRPCCILTRVDKEGKIFYQGSARGCDKVGITNFKDICEDTGIIEYSIGHQQAFGLSISEENVSNFIRITNEKLKDMSDEPIYFVDYIFNDNNVNEQNILDIASMDSFWGSGIDESLIAIKGLKITKEMVILMSPDKNPTLKITLPNKVSIIKFNSSQEEYEKIAIDGVVSVDIIGKCNKNEWMGNITAQVFIEDYEIIDFSRYYF